MMIGTQVYNSQIKSAPVTGWADHRTRQAYDLLEALYHSFGPNPDSDAASAVYEAMEAVEAADCAVSR